MSERSRIALIRFGLGPRLGEPLPADPDAWLDAQLLNADPLPEAATTVDALRASALQLAMDREANAMARAAAAGQPTPTPAPPQAGAVGRPRNELMRVQALDWARRRLTTPEPFRDRLVEFWMNHFTASRRSGSVGPLAATMEREAIRPHLTGRFADMLLAVTRHPAMLLYLDNHVSIGPNSPAGQRARRGLNENLAREVLELHTLSPAGGYTQADVTELAKVLTGWSVLQAEPFGFVWRPTAHEPGPKSLLGRSFPEGPEGQDAALRFLGTHPSTYRHLAVKLARHFVADDPPPDAVRAVERALKETEGDLGAACQVLIRLPAAWTPLTKFRAPADYVTAVGRALALPPERADTLLAAMGGLGQPLWSAPQPNGWPDKAADWAAPEALMRRVDLAYTLAGRATRLDPAEVAEAALGPLARAETVGAMRVAGSVRDALTLLLASPEFMHR
jgi:uncharacterized protein (DUF1800 family)